MDTGKETDGRKSAVMLTASLVIVGTVGVFRRCIPLSSALIAFFRGMIGAAFLLVFMALRKKRVEKKISGKMLGLLALGGAFLGINWLLLFEAFNHTTVAKATLCYYFQPTIVLLLSTMLFKEKLTGRKLLCALAALIGMVFVSGVLNGGTAGTHDIRGILLAVGAACFYALVVILNKKTGGVDPYRKTVLQLFFASAALVPSLLIHGDFRHAALDGRSALLLLAVGLIHTGVVYILYFGSMSGLRAQTISALSYIDPVTAMIVSAAVLGEKMTWGGMIGAALIIGAAFVSEHGQAAK